MNVVYCENESVLSQKMYDQFLQLKSAKNRVIRGFLPAGKSALGFYQQLIAQSELWKRQVIFLQIDEFRADYPFFLIQLQSQVIGPLLWTKDMESISNSWSEKEFGEHLKRVLQKPIDFSILGLGPNGHIGFHEPGIGDDKFYGGQTHLSEESFRRVAGAPSRSVFTFGAGAFMQAEKVFLLITGDGKDEIYRKFLQSKPDASLPASLLKNHPDLTVLTTYK